MRFKQKSSIAASIGEVWRKNDWRKALALTVRKTRAAPEGGAYDYSARKATIGFTRVARRAGTKQDAAATG